MEVPLTTKGSTEGSQAAPEVAASGAVGVEHVRQTSLSTMGRPLGYHGHGFYGYRSKAAKCDRNNERATTVEVRNVFLAFAQRSANEERVLRFRYLNVLLVHSQVPPCFACGSMHCHSVQPMRAMSVHAASAVNVSSSAAHAHLTAVSHFSPRSPTNLL